MKPMTLEQAVEEFKKGARILIGEYRHGKCEVINYRDKNTGKPASFTAARHTMEIGDDSFVISERVPDGYDISTWSAPATKGDKVFLTFTGFQITNGVGTFYGTIVPMVQAKK